MRKMLICETCDVITPIILKDNCLNYFTNCRNDNKTLCNTHISLEYCPYFECSHMNYCKRAFNLGNEKAELFLSTLDSLSTNIEGDRNG